MYEKLVITTLGYLGKFANASPKNKNKAQEELEKMFEAFHRELLFWGSDEIIKAYNNWRYGLAKDGGTLKGFEKLLFAFRKDVGHSNRGLKETDLFKLLIKPEDFDTSGNPKNRDLFDKPYQEQDN